MFSLGLGVSTPLTLLVISRQPQCRKYQETNAGADRAGIVRPRGAQEARIPIMPWRDDRHHHGLLERRPTATAVIEHEFEHAVPVGDAECGTVQAELPFDGG